jgi:hypothetical protein
LSGEVTPTLTEWGFTRKDTRVFTHLTKLRESDNVNEGKVVESLFHQQANEIFGVEIDEQ